jgi:hypothetical protein
MTDHSDDYLKIIHLTTKENYRVQNISLQFNRESEPGHVSTLILEGELDSRLIISYEEDVIFLASSYERFIDQDGNWKFERVKDKDKYYSDLEKLIFNFDKDRRQAFQQIISKEKSTVSDPIHLIKNFLLNSNKKNPKKFGVLLDDYHLISASLILEAYSIIQKNEELDKERPEYKKYCEILNRLFASLYALDPYPILTFLKYHRYLDFDFENVIMKCQQSKNYHKNTYNILSKAGGIPVNDAIQYPLDVYRRYLEALSHFINVIRICLDLIEGEKNLKPHLPYIVNCERINRNSIFAPLVRSIDPILRNSESHLNSSYDEKSRKVILKSKRKKGGEHITSYTSLELQDRIIDLDMNLIPALIITFTLQEYSMILRVLESPEYLQTILGIGNRT